MRTTKAISDELLEKCKVELKKQGIRGENGRRLQAIISAKEHGITAVAKIYNTTRKTIARWITKFENNGCDAFKVAPGRGGKTKLDHTQKQELMLYIKENGSTLTASKIQIVIAEKFNKNISKTTVYRLLKEFKFSYITPRPIHHKKNTSDQTEAIKKSGPGGIKGQKKWG
jgi:transposase